MFTDVQNEECKKYDEGENATKKNKFQKPCLKWVGGKTQILNEIMSEFPREMNNYYELFLGGGSVLLALLTLVRCGKITVKGKIYAYDANDALINVYKNIQANKDTLYDYLTKYMREYDGIRGDTINRNPTNFVEAVTSKERY
jgi:DNA adenine methylase